MVCRRVGSGTSVSGDLSSTAEGAWRNVSMAIGSMAQADLVFAQKLRRLVVRNESALGPGMLDYLGQRGVEVLIAGDRTLVDMLPHILDG
jgi:hypothetical protein